ELARHGRSVLVLEAAETVGGGARSAELTLPGYVHDVCSAVHPLGIGSPFFRTLPLDQFGLDWVHPDAPLAHPLDDRTAAVVERSVDATAKALGPDGPAYRKLFAPLAAAFTDLTSDLLGPVGLPRHPLTAMRFGLRALRSARGLIEAWFHSEPAKALLAGVAA